MSQMGSGMLNGMTLTLSLWGGPRSPGSNDWLDTGSNGPCTPGQSSPGSGGSVTFSNIRFGPIGRTASLIVSESNFVTFLVLKK